MLRRVSLALMVLLSLAGSLAGVGATEQSDLETEDLTGIESAYNRSYLADVNAEADSGAGYDPDTLLLTTLVSVFTYDTPENAEENLDRWAEDFLIIHFGNSDAEPEEVDLGDGGVAYHGTTEVAGKDTTSDLLMFQRDEMVIMIWTIGGDGESGAELTEEIGEWMLDQEIEDETVDLDTSGNSTGGAFDLMPDDEEAYDLMGMLVDTDGDILARAAEAEADAEASPSADN